MRISNGRAGPGGGDYDGRDEPLYRADGARLNPKLKIIARASEEDAEKHLVTAGADSVVSPYFLRDIGSRSLFAAACGEFSGYGDHSPGIDLEIGQILSVRIRRLRGKPLRLRGYGRIAV